MKPFEESLRYAYPVTPGWIVMDVGAHHGEFALAFSETHRAMNPLIRSYEPVPEFYAILERNVCGHPHPVLITRKPHGLGAKNRKQFFRVKGAMSGPWADDGPSIIVDIVSIKEEMLYGVPGDHVDLIKINIEGGEYELLEAILDANLAKAFNNLQIQFHGIPDLNPVERWKKIRECLSATHTLEYADPSGDFTCNSWEGWKIK